MPERAKVDTPPNPFDDNLTTVETALGEHVFHRTRGMASHPGHDVGVGVQRDCCGGVAEEFLDILGVHVAGEQQRRAGMTEVVEAYQ